MLYKDVGMPLDVFKKPTAEGKIWIRDADDGFVRIEVVNYNEIRRMFKKAPF